MQWIKKSEEIKATRCIKSERKSGQEVRLGHRLAPAITTKAKLISVGKAEIEGRKMAPPTTSKSGEYKEKLEKLEVEKKSEKTNYGEKAKIRVPGGEQTTLDAKIVISPAVCWG